MMTGHKHCLACPRRTLGGHRTPAAAGATEAEGWSSAHSGPCRPRRHHLRPAHLVPLATAAADLGCGSGTTCWRRLRDQHEAGVWEKLHERLLGWLRDEAAIDWSRASVDSLSVRAKRGASRRDQTRPRETQLQVPPRRGSQWHSTGHSPLGGQHSRCNTIASAG